jgi:hypothetical protein
MFCCFGVIAGIKRERHWSDIEVVVSVSKYTTLKEKPSSYDTDKVMTIDE